jgi:hypothetical protein
MQVFPAPLFAWLNSRTGAAHKCSGKMHFVMAQFTCRAYGTGSPHDVHDSGGRRL